MWVQLPSRERAIRSLLEGINLRHFELIINELPRDCVHVIGTYAIRGLVGGFSNHGRFTLDIDAVVRGHGLIRLIEDLARRLGMEVLHREWSVELLKVDNTLNCGLIGFDEALFRSFVSNDYVLKRVIAYIRDYERLAVKGEWYSGLMRRSMGTSLYRLVKSNLSFDRL